MRFVLRFLSVAIIIMSVSAYAMAEESRTTIVDTLIEANRIDPLQHPYLDTAEQVLSRDVLDSTNYVVGTVQDVTFGADGMVQTLTVAFDKGELLQPVTMDYTTNINRPTTDGYILNYDDARLKERYPELLASIQTAAGEESDVLSAKDLIGAPIKSEDGRNVGEVQTILFDKDGTRASALYIKMRLGMFRGDTIAVPLDMLEVTSDPQFKKKVLVLSETETDAITDVLKGR